jgi:hypothetical protein
MSDAGIVWVCVLGAVGWTLVGEMILSEYENSSEVYRKSNSWNKFHPYINPVWLYRNYNVNFFGAFLLTILFNLASPFLNAVYWIGMFIGWIATVGRKSSKERESDD